MVSHNSARLLTSFFGVSGSGRILVPVNFRLVAEEIQYIVDHSGARVLLVDPELAEALSGVRCETKLIIGTEADDELMRFDTEPRPVDRRRGRDGDDQLHQRHDGAAEGRAAHPPQHLGQRDDVRLAHRRQRPRRLPAHPAAVPLQRLGHDLRDRRGWAAQHIILRKVDGAEILRRVDQHGVTLMCGAPAVLNMVLDAAPELERPDPRPRHASASSSPALPRRRRRSSGSRPSSAGSSTRSTASPRRRRCSPSTAAAPSTTTSPRPIAPSGSAAPGAPAIGIETSTSAGRRGARARQRRHGRLLGSARPRPRPRSTHGRDGLEWFHTGDGGTIDAADHYLTILDRKKDVIISGGENVSSIEVEDAIFSHPEIDEVAVIGVPDEKLGRAGDGARRRRPRARRSPRPT